MRATVCDCAPASEVAREIAAGHKAGNRLSCLLLDFIREPLPGTYEILWCSNVLPISSLEKNLTLFKRAVQALTPDCRLISQDAFLWERDDVAPLELVLFAVTMLLCPELGNTYSLVEPGRWLREAGFRRLPTLRLKPGTGDWDGGLLEAPRPGSRVRPRR